MNVLANYLEEDELLDVIEINPYANPFLLNYIPSYIIDIANALISVGINDFDEILQGNPWILDKDPEDIRKFIIEERKKGTEIEEILGKIEKGEFL